MPADRARLAGGARAVVVVRNGFRYDARVLRVARTLRELGYRPLVVAAVTAADQPPAEVNDGIPVLRIRPAAALAWADRRLRPAAPGAATARAAAGEEGGSWSARGGPRSLALRAFRAVRTLDYYARASRVVLRERPVLVHCNDFNTMWIGVVAKLFAGSRVVYDAHELWPDRNGRWESRCWLLAAEWLFVRAADEVVTVSPAIAERMARRYRIRAPTVVRNVPAARPAAPARTDDRLVVYVGALLAYRGLEQAIDAIALVPGVRLCFIGHGSACRIRALRERADGAGLGGRFEIAAPVPPDDVVGAIAGAAVGLSLFQPTCVSHELTLPNKIFEYVAAGVPVLSSDVAASAGFVREHGIGEVVAAGDPRDIARGLRLLLEPARIAELRPRLERAARRLTWEHERSALVGAYARCASRFGCRRPRRSPGAGAR